MHHYQPGHYGGVDDTRPNPVGDTTANTTEGRHLSTTHHNDVTNPFNHTRHQQMMAQQADNSYNYTLQQPLHAAGPYAQYPTAAYADADGESDDEDSSSMDEGDAQPRAGLQRSFSEDDDSS